MSNSAGTADRILAATRSLLEAGRPTTMGAIAAAAGVSRQLLYHHFAGRADLLLALSRSVDAEVRTAGRQRRIDRAPDAVSALRAMVAVQGTIKPRAHGVAMAIDGLRATDPDAAAAWEEREDARHRRVVDVVRRLDREGRLHGAWTVDTAARMAWGTTSQHAWAALVVDAGWSTRTWVRHTTSLLEGALVAPPEA